jgi:phage terminase small subunit
MSDLSEQHKLFARNLLKHKFNQTRAYMETYPDASKESAKSEASRLLTNPNLNEYLQKLVNAQEKQDLVEVEEVIDDLKLIKDRCMQEEPVMEYNKSTKKWEHTGEYQFNATAAIKSLELLGKYKKMFTDKHELTGANGGPIDNNLTIEFINGENTDS